VWAARGTRPSVGADDGTAAGRTARRAGDDGGAGCDRGAGGRDGVGRVASAPVGTGRGPEGTRRRPSLTIRHRHRRRRRSIRNRRWPP